MNIIKIWNGKATEKQLRDISIRLKAGEIAIIPTDTMYAIVGDALNIKAIERICRIKNINPEKTNLSIICSSISMAAEYSRIDNRIFRLMKEHCPGPYTFLLKANTVLPKAFKGRKIVGIRIPDLELDRQLAEKLGNPLITTSIEFTDEDHAVNPELIEETYERDVDLMIQDKESTTDVSTIIDCTGDSIEIIRQGLGEL